MPENVRGRQIAANIIKSLLWLVISLFFIAIPTPTTAIAGSSVITPQEHALNAWIFALGAHENCPAAGIVDTNNKLSYGRFCFQEATFKSYVEKYDLLPGVEDAELMNWIADPTIQRELVVNMIQEPGGWRNWSTTVKKIGMPPSASSSQS